MCLWFSLLQTSADPIRLRTGTLPAKKPRPQAASTAASPTQDRVSGLYLLQVAGALDAPARQQLKQLGVDVLHYIPQNTYLVRLHGARAQLIQAVPFVVWMGEYRPEHKVDKAVQSQAAQRGPNELRVTVLIAPHAPETEIANARSAIGAIRQQSTLRSGTVLRGSLNPARLEALARSPAVLWIEPDRDMRMVDEVASEIVAGDSGPGVLTTSELGYTGAGVTVAVADSGLHNGDAETMHEDLLGRTPAFFHYGNLQDAADEHSHGTHVAGIIAGNGAVGETDELGNLYGLGVAPGAQIIGQRIFDGVGNYEPPPSFERMTRDAVRAGADIGSNSWGDDAQGRYDVSAMEFDELVRDADLLTLGNQQYILEFSAGNAGPAPQTINSPASAKNVIATGASQNNRPDFMLYDLGQEGMADFSSRGPCEDGRIKPDLVAPGTWIASLQSASATDQYAWAPISPNYQYQGGTSQAGPHASGAAAVFVDYYRQQHGGATPSPALVKAALINCALDMDDFVETDPIPNMDEGWGRIYLPSLVDGGLNYDLIDQTVLLTNSQVFEYHVLSGNESPLKITLTYTDVPGFPGAVGALVNDLDLQVVAPNGKVYNGNQFQDGESVPDLNASDSVNNVEQVLIYEPVSGYYTVRITARAVHADAREDTARVDQDFALVISGQTPVPGVGTVMLDRGSYNGSSQIRITLVDTDLAGQPSASVNVRSTTEPNGLTLSLAAASMPGAFTGVVATAVGPAANDGKLQIAHDDTITVTYFDTSLGSDRIGSARADLVPPAISGITEEMVFGQTLITFQTDEPTTAIIRFGTNTAATLLAADSTLDATHAVSLWDLNPQQTYYFLVVATDEAGNSTTNSNGGALFSFVAREPRTVLLVDAYTPNTEDPVIPVESYTSALDQIGISYDVWSTINLGRTPKSSDLRPYRAVVWRLNDGVFSTDTLSAVDQAAIESYLSQGGAFFMASMEQLTRLGAGRFRSQVLRVLDFGEDAGIPEAQGEEWDPITSGMSLLLDYSHYHTTYHDLLGIPDDLADTVKIAPEATPILYDSFGTVAGHKWPRDGQDKQGRLVFLPFPLDAVPDTAPPPNNRATLLGNILKFLVPGFDGQATISFSSPSFTLPSIATVEVADLDLQNVGYGTATATSTSQSAPVSFLLRPTGTRGLFRGSFDIISSTNAASTGRLRVSPTDKIWVDYFDASSGITIRATATVDVAAPAITEISAEPDYRSALVFCQTSERADVTVQFGESIRLGRTATDPISSTSHEVVISGLIPDKTYYYKVTSRDPAGNVTTDDNNGQLYSFKTLKPVLPPWFDNMNTGATNWSVLNGEDSQTSWTLGTPAIEPAHSPPAAWGSNLEGQMYDYIETFLISPAIYLTNGNVATLKFWHNYDFSDSGGFEIEAGQLLLLTDTGTAVTLGDYAETSGGWIEETVDITPHMGKVVYLVWYYVLFSFESLPHPGWFVDDVSVTVDTVASGTINITNNIWQAKFVLSGKTYLQGKGNSVTIPNAVPGQYVLEYADVPFYLTPRPQTNILTAGGNLTFAGNYTYSDVNSNGIPDAWELSFFGNVSPYRTSSTDSDGDGMSDYAEYMAGTDPNSPVLSIQMSAQKLTSSSTLLQWASVPGRQYQAQMSTNSLAWIPASPWLEATSTVSQVVVSYPAGTSPIFRIDASVTNSPAGMISTLEMTPQVTTSGGLQISWGTAVGHAYRVLQSSNAVTWIPATPWMQARSQQITTNLPTAGLSGSVFFKVEAAP